MDIYGHDEMEANSVVALPDGFAKDAGDTLYSWLGSLWRSIHKGDAMIRGLQSSRGIRLAQMYLDLIESAMLQDRDRMPVFHRDLWHPIRIRLSKQDTSQENMLKIGDGGKVIGPQPEGSEYGEGTVFSMGKMALFQDYVTYPLDTDFAGGAASIVDNIVNPEVSLENGVDFWIRNGSIIFRKEDDPLGDESPFEKYDVDAGTGRPEDTDVEAMLWASDVLIDRNYISNHLSYALGADAPSTGVVKRILNSAWSALTSGLTPSLARTMIAAMLDIPVIQGESEVVEDISYLDDGSTLVRTSRGVYVVSPKSMVRAEIHPGSVMKQGDFLDDSVRIYQHMNSSDISRLRAQMEIDVPSVCVGPELIRAGTKFGVYATWNPSEVVQADDDPSHLCFDLGGDPEDVMAFWKDVWRDARSRGVEMSSIIGDAGSTIVPAEFMLRNLVGANTVYVTVDTSRIEDASMMRNPMFFDMLSSVVPSASRLFVVERRSVGDDDVEDLGDRSSDDGCIYAALPRYVDRVESGFPGEVSGRAPSFSEHVSFRFVRCKPVKTRVRKEEEK